MNQTFYPSGLCIYCFSPVFDPLVPESKLTDEHIIPAAIGGTVVLREASCKACKDTIDSFESRLHEILYPFSRRLEVGRKIGKAKKSSQKFRQVVNGEKRSAFVKFSDIPTNFSFYRLHKVPGMLTERNLVNESVALQPNLVTSFFISDGDLMDRVVRSQGKPTVSAIYAEHLARYVMKIAFASASAMYGRITFDSPLDVFIVQGVVPGLANFIAGRDAPLIPDTLHQVGFSLQNGFLVATVQLFAPFVSYEFDVVVGRPYWRYECWSTVDVKEPRIDSAC